MSTTPTPSPKTIIPFFDRQWRVSVDTAAGLHLEVSSSEFADALRVEFAVDTYLLMVYWMCELSIYNMSQAAGQSITGIRDLNAFWAWNQTLIQGDAVAISAGYKYTNSSTPFDPDRNVVYQGRVLQAIWTRDNVVDWKLRLRCTVGLMENTINFVNFPWVKGASALDTLNAVCAKAKLTPTIDSDTADLLDSTVYSRGYAIFGRPYEVIDDIIKTAQIAGAKQGLVPTAWVGPNGLNVRSFESSDLDQEPDHIFAPRPDPTASSGTTQGPVKQTVIGTPEQTWDGIRVRVLLDASVKIGDRMQLIGALVALAPLTPGQGYPAIPSRNGMYVVAGVRHVGDSRGNPWYTEITGLTRDFFANFILARKQ